MLNFYNGSISKLSRKLYPEHTWQTFRFHKVPHGYWQDSSNVLSFMNYAAAKLGVVQLDDWAKIPSEAVEHMGGSTLLIKFGGLRELLQFAYPLHSWNWHSLGVGESFDKEQKFLQGIVQNLLQ